MLLPGGHFYCAGDSITQSTKPVLAVDRASIDNECLAGNEIALC